VCVNIKWNAAAHTKDMMISSGEEREEEKEIFKNMLHATTSSPCDRVRARM
jgi:hypothetical protein